ncbi:MAG: hypothetical protein WD225_01620 [Ilumatobacteraceae bacterium]
MQPRSKRLVAMIAALGLVTAACAGDDDATPATDAPPATEAPADEPETTDAPEPTEPPATEAPADDETADDEMTDDEMTDDEMAETDDDGSDDGDVAPATDDGASSLRATMTSLLQEHVYLAGITIDVAVAAGGDVEDPTVQAAMTELDANSVALSEAVASVAGEENGEAFLGLWREHIGFFVDYTLGVATGDEAMADQALADLEGYQQAAGAFFEDITGGAIVADELVAGLEGHVSTLTAAIDSVVAGEPEAFTNLRSAAQHMFGAALFLSDGIATAAPEMFPGDVESGPAETRAVLTNLLQEHVYLAGIALKGAVDAGGDLEAPAVQAAVATLDENSVALADVVGSVAGEENGEAFLGLWREHIGFFVDYTLGVATGDEAMAEQARADLDGYKQAAGAFFEEITAGELPADALVESLDVHTETVVATIDSLVAGDGQVFAELRVAAQHMPMAALALSTAIVAATS